MEIKYREESSMILGEKIMELRKKNGWSQEEMAGKLNVSRQSVSKWESSMSVPDLDKILQLSELFEVSTDYLLKDDKEEDFVPGNPGEERLRKVTMEEAQEFIRVRRKASVRIASGVAACILSPVPLILLGALAESGKNSVTEGAAKGLGLALLLLIVAGAVMTFILNGTGLGKYEYLETEEFELCYGVAGMVREKSEAESAPFARKIAVGVGLCILGAVPLLLVGVFSANSQETGAAAMLGTAAVAFLLAAVAAGVWLFVYAGMRKGAYDQLLQVGDYTPESKAANKTISKIAAVYWCLVTAAYVGYSFMKGSWGSSWVIWPVTGILFGAVSGFIKMNQKK